MMKIVGRGFGNAPGSGRPESENWHAVLRQATLRTVSDRACAKAYRHARGNAGERFDGARMICAIDPNGRAPLSSGCNGDSGGPLMAGTYDAPRVLGVVSFGGNGCGADHLPSVFAEVERYRSFILSPHPVLAPRATGAATLRALRPPAHLRRPADRRRDEGDLPLVAVAQRPVQGRGPRPPPPAAQGRPRHADDLQRRGHQRRRPRRRVLEAAADPALGGCCTRPLPEQRPGGTSRSWEEGQVAADPRLACWRPGLMRTTSQAEWQRSSAVMSQAPGSSSRCPSPWRAEVGKA